MKNNPYACITAIALVVQTLMLILFYTLPDPLGLSLPDMFEGKTIWQVFMAFGAIMVMGALFAFAKAPRGLAIFYALYFFVAAVDYDVFRFSHQRLSYSFLRTYFHISNIADETTISTLGGDLLGTVLWLVIVIACLAGAAVYVTLYTIRKRKNATDSVASSATKTVADAAVNAASSGTKAVTGSATTPQKSSKKVPVTLFTVGMLLSVTPLILFLAGTRGTIELPLTHIKIDKRFTLGKHTLTAPVLHIAAVETFEFIRDDAKLTDELIQDLDAFLPQDFVNSRAQMEMPLYRGAVKHQYKAAKPYNIVFVMGESFKGRIFNQMLEGDTTLAPNIWALAHNERGGSLWFKNAFSGGYPTVRGTMATYMGFPSHPNRDVPSFYAANKFKGFPEYLTNYKRSYVTVSNPIFDHTLPFVEKFFEKNWYLPEENPQQGTTDSMGVNKALEILAKQPIDKPWLLAFNSISTHIPFFNYPDDYAEKPDDSMVRYRNALRYTDVQLGRFFKALEERPDYENTVVIILGDHDTPVDSVDYAVPQPLGVSSSQIFMGIFAADSALLQGFTVREDVASQLDMGPTIFDLAQVREPNHFWGYDLLTQERPYEQPSVFFSQNAYYLGFRDRVLTGGLENEDVYAGVNGTFTLTQNPSDLEWKKKAVGASKVVRSILRNDTMMP